MKTWVVQRKDGVTEMVIQDRDCKTIRCPKSRFFGFGYAYGFATNNTYVFAVPMNHLFGKLKTGVPVCFELTAKRKDGRKK
jgi:hypothetical protein